MGGVRPPGKDFVMKKHFSRILSLLLAFLLCVPMALTAFAEDTASAGEADAANAPFDYDSL